MALDSAWVALSLIPQLSGRTFYSLLEHFGTPHAVLKAKIADLCSVAGVGKQTAQAIHAIRLDLVKRAIDRWLEAGIQIITFREVAYPPLLSTLPDSPPTLFVRGSLGILRDTYAIVGTRTPSPLAQQHAFHLAKAHAEAGTTIISGLALGIDTQAHEGALATLEGKTWAVLGGGILDPYPPQNRPLVERILGRGGAILCECAPDASVNSQRLIARNRIISGLAQALLLVESDRSGGAMHAVNFALKQGRRVTTLDLPASGNQLLLTEGVAEVHFPP